jgi:hypothetical protein
MYDYEPKVNETREFIEIANDFANPLDIIREAISNAYDAESTKIDMSFDVIQEDGESIFKITMSDNGKGMNEDELKAFFDLGNSTRRKSDVAIGEKGHGTKVYFNSKKILVTTIKDNMKIIGEAVDPYKELHSGRKPIIHIATSNEQLPSGTKIEIWEYNKNRRDKFTHAIIKDHVLWFTRHGGIDILLENCKYKNVELKIKGLDRETSELIKFGHLFPDDSTSLDKLLDEHLTKAPDYYCKKIIKRINRSNHPEVARDVIISIEGKYIKFQYNNMIRRPGYQAPNGSYTMAERYGLWLCKDYMPIQRKNEWVTIKGQEHTRFQAFVNCQNFKLTANRGSIENTPTELVADIELAIRKIFDEMYATTDWTNIEYLENEASASLTTEREKKNYTLRIEKVKKANIVEYKGHILVEPQREQGVYSLFLILDTIDPTIFPFSVIDYDTHEGIDVIVKGDATTPIQSARLFYVEFKYFLDQNFNHSFENLHSVICWDTSIKNGDEITDLNNESRKMVITQPSNDIPYKTYMLDNPRKVHKINVIVLKDYLKEKLGIEFRPRTNEDVL